MKTIRLVVILIVLLMSLAIEPHYLVASPLEISDYQFSGVGLFTGSLGIISLFLMVYLIRSFFRSKNRIGSTEQSEE